MQDWKEYVEQTILDGTTYTGNKDANKRIFSASMLSNDMLQNFLKFKYGTQKQKVFGANTFGSCYHIGMEEIFKNQPNVETELSLSKQLDNGWTISGTLDLVLHDYEIILDHKTTTANTIAKTKSEGRTSGYALQLGVYKYLLHAANSLDYSGALGFVDKTHSFFKQNKFNQLELMKVPTYSYDETEDKLYTATNALDEYLELDQEPPRCKNLFPYKPKGGGRTKNMRCIHYCDNNINCSHYSEYHAMNSLLEL